jgi:iron(III) transport system ATP-binding protein
MRVSIRNLTKRFGAVTALKSISLEIGDQELFFLLGPSGCGKTTLLRTIAGFYQPDEGDLLFGERSMCGVPAHQRNAGMVFQNYALWPHMSVEQNVAYGLDVRGVKGAEKRDRVREALGIVQMEPYAARTPNQLSGGQQQRVALARALINDPAILLADEPTGNLDSATSHEIMSVIRALNRERGVTVIVVTHEPDVAAYADRTVTLRDGLIESDVRARHAARAPSPPSGQGNRI